MNTYFPPIRLTENNYYQGIVVAEIVAVQDQTNETDAVYSSEMQQQDIIPSKELTSVESKKRARHSTNNIDTKSKRQRTGSVEKNAHQDLLVGLKKQWDSILTKASEEIVTKEYDDLPIARYAEISEELLQIKKSLKLNKVLHAKIAFNPLLENINLLLEMMHPYPMSGEAVDLESKIISKIQRRCQLIKKSNAPECVETAKNYAELILFEHRPKLYYNHASFMSTKTELEIQEIFNSIYTAELTVRQEKWNQIFSLYTGEIKRFSKVCEVTRDLYKNTLFDSSSFAVGLCHELIADTFLKCLHDFPEQESGTLNLAIKHYKIAKKAYNKIGNAKSKEMAELIKKTEELIKDFKGDPKLNADNQQQDESKALEMPDQQPKQPLMQNVVLVYSDDSMEELPEDFDLDAPFDQAQQAIIAPKEAITAAKEVIIAPKEKEIIIIEDSSEEEAPCNATLEDMMYNFIFNGKI